MKRNNIIYNLLILFFMFSCSNESKKKQSIDLMSMITNEIKKIDSVKGNELLCLLIADNMCVECINTEFINIRSSDVNVCVVGVFKNKREFKASASSVHFQNKLFIQKSEENFNVIPSQPFYFLYNSSTKTISDVFYPKPCKEALTIQYYDEIKKIH